MSTLRLSQDSQDSHIYDTKVFGQMGQKNNHRHKLFFDFRTYSIKVFFSGVKTWKLFCSYSALDILLLGQFKATLRFITSSTTEDGATLRFFN